MCFDNVSRLQFVGQLEARGREGVGSRAVNGTSRTFTMLGQRSRGIAKLLQNVLQTILVDGMERLYMEAQDGLKTIAPPLFLNIFFYFLLV